MSNKNKVEDMEEMVPENQADQLDAQQQENQEGGKDGADIETQLKEELAKEKDKFLRLFAEFENYKKRTSKERMELFKTAGQEVIVSLLPVLDDFDRALKELARSEDDEMFKGVELIGNKFKEVLKSKGLSQIEVNPGDAFDADVHEAITQIPVPDENMKGKIVDVIEKGFALGEKIIRHPKVVVGN